MSGYFVVCRNRFLARKRLNVAEFIACTGRNLPRNAVLQNEALSVKIHSLMMNTTQERRRMRRFDMHLPALIRLSNAGESLEKPRQTGGSAILDSATQEPGAHEFWTETQNVSARGIFFYLDRPLSAGSELEITMTFPPHVTMTGSVRVKFVARVLRVEAPLPLSRTGIAAVIEEYEFLRAVAPSEIASGGTDFLQN